MGADQSIDTLRARAATLEEISGEFERWFKAREDASENQYVSKENQFATILADLRRETIGQIKRIERTAKRDADEFRGKL